MAFFNKIKKGDKVSSVRESSNGKEVVINVGSHGVRDSVVDNSRQDEYNRLLAEIDYDMIKLILYIADKSETKNQLFTKLEDEGVNLLYLVAMGIATEEVISSYRTLRDRGVDTMAVTFETKGVDEDYYNEIMVESNEIPTLMDLSGNYLEEMSDPIELFKKSESERYRLEREVTKLKSKVKELMEAKETQEVVGVTNSETTIGKEVSDFVDISEEFEELGNNVDDKDVIDTTEAADWQEELNRLTRNLNASRGTEEDEEDDDQRKVVYILTSDMSLDREIEGYDIRIIKEPVDLTMYASSKDNLLVITRMVPRQLVNIFSNWIKKVTALGEKLRVVTLEGQELEHVIIEDVIQLNKDSLDRYYEDHKQSKYVGTGVRTFFDIEDNIDL